MTMIPIPVSEEPVPPLRSLRAETLAQLEGRRFELLIVGATALARELFRLASHNTISALYLCEGDYLGEDPQRRAISEILSARYDGGVDLNHVEVLALNHYRDGEVQVKARCRRSQKIVSFTCGAVVNESGMRLGAGRARGGSPHSQRGLFNRVTSEQSAVFRFDRGSLRELSTSKAAIKTLRCVLTEGIEATTQLVPLNTAALIDAYRAAELPEHLRAGSTFTAIQARINEFVEQGSGCGVSLDVIDRAINRFGARVSHIPLLPRWHEELKGSNGETLSLRGEFHLAAVTELPASVEELLTRRLMISGPMISSLRDPDSALRLQDDLTELRALFEELQHVDPLG